MLITIWHHLLPLRVTSSSKFSHCLAGGLTFNIFGSGLTCDVFRLMWDLTAKAWRVKTTWSSTRVNLNQMNAVIWDGWMPCGSIITAGATCSGSGLCIAGVPQHSQSPFLVRLPMGSRGRCIRSMLGLQHVSLFYVCKRLDTHKNGAWGSKSLGQVCEITVAIQQMKEW